jgi:hypothetical protein
MIGQTKAAMTIDPAVSIEFSPCDLVVDTA